MNEVRAIGTFQVVLAGFTGGLVTIAAAAAISYFAGKGPIHWMPAGGNTTNSPIKVRGGAMTFRASNTNPWNATGASTYCTDNADTTYLELLDFRPDETPRIQFL